MFHKKRAPNELRDALRACRDSFLFVGVFSMFINLLMLVPAIYMLQVYDRVLVSSSETTLWMLTLLAVGLLAIMGALELVRSRILVRVAARIDTALSPRLFGAMFDADLRGLGRSGGQPLQDLAALRQFLSGTGPFGFFDVPWVPVYMAVLFALHPWIGWLSVGGGVFLVGLAIANELATRGPLGKANSLHIAGNNNVVGNLRNAEVLHAMGILEAVRRRWDTQHAEGLRLQALASDRAALLTNASKATRIALQSLVLGLGAYLAIRHEITPGAMIAGSIILGRALAPVDLLIGTWKGFLGARGSYGRLQELLQAVPERSAKMSLPAPKGNLVLEQVVAGPPGARTPVLRGLSFALTAGESLGVIGPSAAGKSSLARVILGVWPPAAGSVRLDGAEVSQWNREELGPYVGYLPQDIELSYGTVAENIARFGTVDSQEVVRAAQRAGVHELILQLPQGYDTPVGEGGGVLSGGQRQRIALARAIYGRPVLVVLDEPNSNLDEQGDAALVRAIAQLKEDGATVVIVTHRPSVLNIVDKIVGLREGSVHLFGARNEVLAQLARPTPVARTSLPTQRAR